MFIVETSRISELKIGRGLRAPLFPARKADGRPAKSGIRTPDLLHLMADPWPTELSVQLLSSSTSDS